RARRHGGRAASSCLPMPANLSIDTISLDGRRFRDYLDIEKIRGAAMVLVPVLIILHATGGGVALAAGPVPLLSRKGGRLHRQLGKVYAAAMALAAGSGLVLALVKGSTLLLCIAVFTGFLVYTGLRALAFLRRRPRSSSDDII